MPAVSFSTIVQPDPDGVLLIEVPARVMAALTENIDYPDDGGAVAAKAGRKAMVRRAVRLRDDDKKKDDKKDAAPPPVPSALQMVVKLTVPVADVRAEMGSD